MPRYECKKGTSNKFWEIEQDRKKVFVRFGRIGSKGQERVKTFSHPWKVRKYMAEQIRGKLKKGYELLRPDMPQPDPKAAHNPELEAMIAAEPERVEGYEVYSDWLQAQGDPRGELISVDNALRRSPKSQKLLQERARLRAPYDQQLRQLAEAFNWQPAFADGRMTAEWELGFIRKAQVGHDWYADMDSADLMDVGEFFTHLFALPSMRLIQDLTVGLWRDSDGQCKYNGFFAAVSQQGLPTLRRLFVGDYQFPSHIEISWTELGQVAPLYSGAPRLEELTLQGGSMDLGQIDCPKLRSFDLRTGGLAKQNIQAITNARWPALERLSVWFGDNYYGFDGSVEDIAPILAGEGLANLRHLGLKNAEFTDALCGLLASSEVLPQLESLDLSMGMMTDDGAATLAARRDRFKHLRLLDVSESYLSSEGRKLLEGICAKVITVPQREVDVWDDGEHRFVSVGE